MDQFFTTLTKTMILSSGANDDQILLLNSLLPKQLPNDFISFLRLSNGVNGMIGDSYLEICRVEDIPRMNEEYEVNLFASGLILFGSDGGGEGYGFDYRGENPTVVEIPFIGMDWKEAIKKGDTFFEFLSILAAKPS